MFLSYYIEWNELNEDREWRNGLLGNKHWHAKDFDEGKIIITIECNEEQTTIALLSKTILNSYTFCGR